MLPFKDVCAFIARIHNRFVDFGCSLEPLALPERKMTAHEIWTLSPTGELSHIWSLYDQARYASTNILMVYPVVQ